MACAILGSVLSAPSALAQNENRRKRTHPKKALVLLLAVVMAVATACSLQEVTPLVQQALISPLAPQVDPALTQTRWQLAEGSYQGEPLQLDAIWPLYVLFEEFEGAVFAIVRSDRCEGVVAGFELDLSDQKRYRVVRGDMTLVPCGEPADTQLSTVHDAIRATTSYTIQGGQLILTGEETRLVFDAIPNP
jgi:hypothetical protein